MVSNDERSNECLICKNRNIKTKFLIKGYTIKECRTCSFTFLDYVFSDERSHQFYNRSYFEGSETDKGYENYEKCETFLTRNFLKRLNVIKKFVNNGSVLDIGCGYGFFLNCLDDNYTGVGVDVSTHAIEYAKNRLNVNAIAGQLDDCSFPNKSFEIITMWDTIEHLNRPESIFKEINKLLSDEGVLAITTGNVASFISKIFGKKWHLYNLPEHLWFFSYRTIQKFLNKYGFEIVEKKYDISYYSIGYILERLKKTLLPNNILNKIPIHETKLNNIIIPFSLYDIMFLICKRRINKSVQ